MYALFYLCSLLADEVRSSKSDLHASRTQAAAAEISLATSQREVAELNAQLDAVVSELATVQSVSAC